MLSRQACLALPGLAVPLPCRHGVGRLSSPDSKNKTESIVRGDCTLPRIPSPFGHMLDDALASSLGLAPARGSASLHLVCTPQPKTTDEYETENARRSRCSASASASATITMDAEGADAAAAAVTVPLPETYSRNGKWTVYSGCNPSRKRRDPNGVLSKEAQAKREKEHELGTKVSNGSGARVSCVGAGLRAGGGFCVGSFPFPFASCHAPVFFFCVLFLHYSVPACVCPHPLSMLGTENTDLNGYGTAWR